MPRRRRTLQESLIGFETAEELLGLAAERVDALAMALEILARLPETQPVGELSQRLALASASLEVANDRIREAWTELKTHG